MTTENITVAIAEANLNEMMHGNAMGGVSADELARAMNAYTIAIILE